MKSSNSNQVSIYRSQCTQIRLIFERAESPSKVLCVAVDYAKDKHVALICDGNGAILKNPFPVHNSAQGVEFLRKQIASTARRRKIPNEQIFIGGEDLPSYVENFVQAIGQNFLIVRVNAWEAKENRENRLATTDNLDLLGIAKTLVSRRARTASDPLLENDSVYQQMRDLTRARRQLVQQKTATSNRIHTLVDRLFPGFLVANKSGLTPFGPASLALMKDRFSSTEIQRRRSGSLSNFLRRHRVHHPEEKAAQLRSFAQSALPPDPHRINSSQNSLRASVELYQCLHRNTKDLANEASLLLASTPYAVLTSIGGFGLTLASGWASELGDPKRLGGIDSLCAYSGVVPGTTQTGGPDKPPKHSHTSKKCNHFLKDWVVQSANKVALYGPEEWRQRHARWVASGQHAQFVGAKRLLRTARTLLKYEVPWMDSQARVPGASKAVRGSAAEQIWEPMITKWRGIPNWQEVVFSPDRPLGSWRKIAVEVDKAYLPLPGE